jgi:RimJ/RimL family protein N-acetyltransferase
MASGQDLAVREMHLDEVDIRIDYFHESSDDHLRMLGVERAKLPARAAWRSIYQEDYSRSIEERQFYSLIWELDGAVVGFSSTDRIRYGLDAFMHLHVVQPDLRQKGLGSEYVRMSIDYYFRVLNLERLFCEPNAFNVAPNRALQRAGFRYLFTHETTPTSINFFQAVTRWVAERNDAH